MQPPARARLNQLACSSGSSASARLRGARVPEPGARLSHGHARVGAAACPTASPAAVVPAHAARVDRRARDRRARDAGNRRLVRRRWIGIPIGMFVHLVLDGVWTDTHEFWWPLFGTSFEGRLPELDRGAVSLVLELIGVAAIVWGWRRFGLDDPRARARFVRTGSCRAACHPLMPELARADRRSPRQDGGERVRTAARTSAIRRSTRLAGPRRPRWPPRSLRSARGRGSSVARCDGRARRRRSIARERTGRGRRSMDRARLRRVRGQADRRGAPGAPGPAGDRMRRSRPTAARPCRARASASRPRARTSGRSRATRRHRRHARVTGEGRGRVGARRRRRDRVAHVTSRPGRSRASGHGRGDPFCSSFNETLVTIAVTVSRLGGRGAGHLGGRRRGKSGLHRAGCWREPGRGDLSVQGNREQTADGCAGSPVLHR